MTDLTAAAVPPRLHSARTMTPAKSPWFGEDSRFRWWLIRLLNRLWFTCWADLVSWAMGSHDKALRMCFDQRPCRRDLGRLSSCYCGKVHLPDDQVHDCGWPVDSAGCGRFHESFERVDGTWRCR